MPSSSVEPSKPIVELTRVRHGFGQGDKFLLVIEDVTLAIGEGEFVAIVGPSGCGKSTLLRVISGLSPALDGEVRVRGRTVDNVRTDVGYMFQTDALLPWRTVLDNVALPLKFKGVDRARREAKAREWI